MAIIYKQFIVTDENDVIKLENTRLEQNGLKVRLVGKELQLAETLAFMHGYKMTKEENASTETSRVYRLDPILEETSKAVRSAVDGVRVRIINYLFACMVVFALIAHFANDDNDEKIFTLVYGLNSILNVCVGYYFGEARVAKKIDEK